MRLTCLSRGARVGGVLPAPLATQGPASGEARLGGGRAGWLRVVARRLRNRGRLRGRGGDGAPARDSGGQRPAWRGQGLQRGRRNPFWRPRGAAASPGRTGGAARGQVAAMAAMVARQAKQHRRGGTHTRGYHPHASFKFHECFLYWLHHPKQRPPTSPRARSDLKHDAFSRSHRRDTFGGLCNVLLGCWCVSTACRRWRVPTLPATVRGILVPWAHSNARGGSRFDGTSKGSRIPPPAGGARRSAHRGARCQTHNHPAPPRRRPRPAARSGPLAGRHAARRASPLAAGKPSLLGRGSASAASQGRRMLGGAIFTPTIPGADGFQETQEYQK